MTQMLDIKNSIVTRLQAVLPAEYKALGYIEDVEQNNWEQITLAYGVRALAASEVAGVNKEYTLNQSYEVILTERYLQQLQPAPTLLQ